MNSCVHIGLGDDPRAKAMASHRGRESTYQKLSERFYWRNMVDDVASFIKTCDECQRHGKASQKLSPELHSIPVPNNAMRQIGVDICRLPEVDGFNYLVVCIDYFTKWSEAKPLKEKAAHFVAQFLYEVICRHGCIQIQINDQGREFVNEVNSNLHRMTGTEQRVTSAYHPQANGLVERQNRSIKESLVKVLNEKPTEWPYIIEGILFAHRVSRHYSTKYSPFQLLYNREPTLPIDLKYNLDEQQAAVEQIEDVDGDHPFDVKTFDTVLSQAKSIREEVYEVTGANIVKAQAKQQRDYNRRHQLPNSLNINDKVLLKNQKRTVRKGGKFTYKLLGPYAIQNISQKGLCTLVNANGKSLKKIQRGFAQVVCRLS